MFTKSLSTLAIAVTLGTPAFAVDEVNVTTGFTLDGVPLAVHGVDTVALSSLNVVAAGDAMHTVVHNGAAYYFGSMETAEMFKANPEQYLPQYGGFCALAVMLGKKLDGDPRYADIVDGKLYLFVNATIFQKYKENPEAVLAKAAEMWPSIQHKAVGEL